MVVEPASFHRQPDALDGEELAAARADHADNIHAQMAAVFGHPGFSTLFVPALSRAWIAFEARLVGKPDVHFSRPDWRPAAHREPSAC